LTRVVVAIDPAVTSGEEADETGIVVAGKDKNGHGYVLADISGHYPPTEWARLAITAYATHRADPWPRSTMAATWSGHLSETQVANIEPLKGLTALQDLNLWGTQAANIEPLKGLTALQKLNLSRTQVANIEPLKGLTALQNLNLSGTQVANIEPLAVRCDSAPKWNLV
jgi:Leucine Rich repeats (2 copies)